MWPAVSAAERAWVDYLEARAPREVHAAIEALIVARYARVDLWIDEVVTRPESGRVEAPAMTRARRIDEVVTHRVWGPMIFLGVMALVFQSTGFCCYLSSNFVADIFEFRRFINGFHKLLLLIF